MFNIGIGEILIVLLVAFVIVGPDDLPKVARWLGRQFRRLRVLIRDIKAETGWDEVEKEVRGIQKDVKQTVREMDISADLRDAVKDVNQEIDGISRDMKADFRKLDAEAKAEMKSLDDGIRAAAGPSKDAADEQKTEEDKP